MIRTAIAVAATTVWLAGHAAAQQQQQSVEAQLKAGASDRLDLLSARFELSVATLAHLDGQARVQQAMGALEDALQRPVDSIERTNSTSALISATPYPPERSEK